MYWRRSNNFRSVQYESLDRIENFVDELIHPTHQFDKFLHQISNNYFYYSNEMKLEAMNRTDKCALEARIEKCKQNRIARLRYA